MDSGETHPSPAPDGSDATPTESQQIDSDLLTRIDEQIARANDSTSELPPRIGRWTIRNRLGAGAMGTVFRGFCSRTGELAAIKVAMPNPVACDMLRKEAEALDRVQHPAIPKLREAGEIDGTPYIAVELVQGQDLAERIRSDPPSGRDAIAWIRDVARGAHALHRTGFVHRDIKPANIVVDDNGRPFLIDLGLAASSGTRERRLVGTLLYMAPEQLRSGSEIPGPVRPATDVYALASSLHHALTGTIWTAAASIDALAHKIYHQSPPLGAWATPNVPRAIGPTLGRALQKNLEKRHQSAAEFADELDAVLRGETTPSMNAAERRAHLISRHRIAIAVVTTIAVVLTTASWFTANARAAERERIASRIREVQDHAARTRLVARDSILRQANHALASNDPIRAVNLLREHAADYADDEIFTTTFRGAIHASAEPRFEEVVTQISFGVPDISAGYSYRSRVEDARADLAVVGESGVLTLLLALHAYHHGEKEEALAILDSHASALGQNPMAADVRALATLQDDAPDLSGPTIARLSNSSGLASPAAKCIRGLVLLRVAGTMLTDPARIEVVRHMLATAIELAHDVRKVDPNHRCALTIESLAHLSSEQPWRAITPLTDLENLSTDSDEPGVHLSRLKAELAAASDPERSTVNPRSIERRLAALLDAAPDEEGKTAIVAHLANWIASRIRLLADHGIGPTVAPPSAKLFLELLEPNFPAASIALANLIRQSSFASLAAGASPDVVGELWNCTALVHDAHERRNCRAVVHDQMAWAAKYEVTGLLLAGQNDDAARCVQDSQSHLARCSVAVPSPSAVVTAIRELLEATRFALDAQRDSGRVATLRDRLREIAASCPDLADWVELLVGLLN